MNDSTKTPQQNNSRLPRGTTYSARQPQPKDPGPSRDASPTDEPRARIGRAAKALEGVDFRVYQAGLEVAGAVELAGDGLVRLGQAVTRSGRRVGAKAERLAMYVAAVEDALTDGG